MMLKNLLNQRVALGRLIVVLLFASGLVFAGTFDGFVVKTAAQKSSCGGGDAPCSDSIAQPEVQNCCGSGKIADLPSNGTKGETRILDDDPCECLGNGSCGDTSCEDCGLKSCACPCDICSSVCSSKDSGSSLCGSSPSCGYDDDRSGGSEG